MTREEIQLRQELGELWPRMRAAEARLAEAERQVNDCWCGATTPMELLRGLRLIFPVNDGARPADSASVCAGCGEPTDAWDDGTRLCWKCQA